MIFTRAIQGRTNLVFQLVWWQRSVGLDNPTFAMYRRGLNRVEPRALDRQRANKNADVLAGLFHLQIMSADPVGLTACQRKQSIAELFFAGISGQGW